MVGITPKREIAESFHGVQSTIMIAALLCIVIAVSIPSLMIVNYSKRTDNIIRFMRKVEKEFVPGCRIPRMISWGKLRAL